ncbi:MAG: aminotransferase class I/II-fold pyridoxal phosphate-dependent enzyme [Clostridiales bacterium]|nr:aminotransferase class I/II-fold pyridoxal phosphate-dependent enzyme [Clostridiales bacterium]
MKAFKDMSKDELNALKIELEKEYSDYKDMGLNLNMMRGNPAPEQLSLSNKLFEGLEEKTSFKTKAGVDCRNYGLPTGLPETKELFAQILDTKAENIFIGNASSLNMMFDTLMRACAFGEIDSDKPWFQVEGRKWLCPTPGYDRHFKVTEKLGFELIAVPMTPNGPDMDIVEELVKDPKVLGMWSIPVYSNPDGIVYSKETCERLASMKTGAKDFRLFWDNAYVVHHLYDDEATQGSVPDMLALCEKYGNANRVYEFASTSKISFAGSGLACMACNTANMEAAVKTIGIQAICSNKVNQLAHSVMFPDLNAIKERMSKHADILRPKFEMTINVLKKELGDTGICNWHEPKGGFFVSVFVLPGTAKATVAMCKDLGVALTPAGATYPYGNDPQDSNIRFAPSFPSLEDIEKAVKVFTLCAKLSAVNKLLEA